jgi:hypothetical protein
MEENKLLYGDARAVDYPLQEINKEELLNRYRQQQNAMQPYVNALQSYLNNYDAMVRNKQNADRFWQGASSLTGNQAWSKMSENFNPLKTEADRINILKSIAEEKMKQTAGEDELIGNAYIAQMAGLPPESALGSKDVFKAVSPIMSSMNALRGKMYSADRSIDRAKLLNDAKIQIAQMNNARAMAIAKGTWSTQKEIAFNRDKANMQRALVQAIGFGADPSQLLGTTNALNLTDVDIEALQKYMDGDL